MSEHKYTPGPWVASGCTVLMDSPAKFIATVGAPSARSDEDLANARLIAAAPTQHEEMLRYLPIIERAEADPELWARLTDGTGIATANGYRAAIAKAGGETP